MKQNLYRTKTLKWFNLTFSLLLLNVLLIGGAFAQNDETCVQMQTGDTPQYLYPFSGKITNSYFQQIYTKAELEQNNIESGDIISSIEFNYFWERPTKRPIKILMGNTVLELFDDGWVSANSLNEVLSSGCQEFSNANENWTKLTLTTPFEYTGENIIIAILVNEIDATDPTCFTEKTNDNRFYSHQTENGRSIYKRTATTIKFDETSGKPLVGSTALASDLLNIRTNIKLCTKPASCKKVSDVNISDITETSLKINWTAGETENSWYIEYGESGFNEGSGTILEATTTSYEITNLSMMTSYDFYIRSKCSENDKSVSTALKNVITACGIIPVSSNYIEDFDINNASLHCWTIVDVANDATPDSNFGKWTFTDNEAIYTFHLANQANDWLISPRLNLTQNLTLGFDYRISPYAPGFPSQEKFSVYVITGEDPNDLTNAGEPLFTKTTNNETKITSSISLSEYTGQQVFLAIKCESGVGNAYLHIDNFRVYSPSNQNDITSFTFPTQTGEATINTEDHKVNIEVSYSSDLTNLTPTISVSEYAKINPASGIARNFSSPITYNVIAENANEQSWLITVTRAASGSPENSILSFTFEDQVGEAAIDYNEHTISAEINWEKSLTNILPVIEISPFAKINPLQGTIQNFSQPVIYTVTADNGDDQIWTVTIKNAPPPVGANCENPVVINLSQEGNPYATELQTTKDYGNVYSDTDLGAHDNGPDKIYKLSVEQNSIYEILLYTITEHAAIGLFKGCPSENVLLKKAHNNYSTENLILNELTLNPNTEYYLMVDNMPPNPDFLALFTLTFTKDENPSCTSPIDLEALNILQKSVDLKWSQALSETEWELKFGPPDFDPANSGTPISNITTPSYTLPGLVENTEYSVYIRSKCSDTEKGKWIGPRKFRTLATCPRPTNLVINPSINSASVTWNGYNASNWEVEYKLASATNYEKITTNTNSCTLSNLIGSNSYQIRVYAICEDAEMSTYSEEITFQTECSNIDNLPFFENFENNISNNFPYCWLRPVTNDLNYTVYPSIDNGTYFNPAKSIKFRSQPETPTIVSTPLINEDIKDLILEISLKKEGEGSGDMTIGVMSNPNNPASFVEAKTISPTSYDSNKYLIDFHANSISGTNLSIAFKHTSYNEIWAYFLYDVKLRSKSKKNDILTFSVPGLTTEVEINNTTHEITGTVTQSTNIEALVPTITISEGAKLEPTIGTVTNFTNTVEYTVTAENGDPQVWKVTLTKLTTASSENKILSFNFLNQVGESIFDYENNSITAEIDWQSSLTSISPTIEISNFATISPASGTVQDFSSEQGVKYTVKAENEDEQIWTVTITNANPPDGANCDFPVILNLSDIDSPHTISNETTEGFGNIYDDTDLGSYDNGQDKIYKIIVNENSMYSINLYSTTSRVGMGLFKGCPSENKLIKKETSSSTFSSHLSISDIPLNSNIEYFLMVDKRGAPNHIPSFNLTFTKNETPPCTSPNTLEISDLTKTSLELIWEKALNETEWEIKYGESGLNPMGSEGTSINVINTTTHTLNISELPQNTNYDIYIRSKCSDTETGQWMGPVKFKTLEICARPTEVQITNISTNSATISWNGHNSENWILEYKLSTESEYQTKEASTNSFLLEELTSSSSYNIRIKAKCGETDESSYSVVKTFTTSCNSITSFPYLEKFDEGSQSLNCWTIIDVNGGGPAAFEFGKWTFSDDVAIYTYSTNNSPADDWLISPSLKIDEEYYLSFNYRSQISNSSNEKFSVYLITENPQNYGSATPLLSNITVENLENITIEPISLLEYINQEIYIGIKCESDGNMGTLIIDNFRVYSSENPLFTLTASVEGGNGIISPSYEVVSKSSEQTFTITPNNGYVIDVLKDNEEVKTSEVSEGNYTITNIEASHTIVVSFKEDTPSITAYTLTASVDGGNGTIDPTSSSVNAGGEETFTIAAAEGYELESLIDNDTPKTVDDNGQYKLMDINEDHTIVVKFKLAGTPSPSNYTLKASVEGGNGTINPIEETAVTAGSNFEFTITANEGYELEYLKDNGQTKTSSVTSDGKYKLTGINSDHTIVVKFKEYVAPTIYKLTTEVLGGNGSISPTSSEVYANGSQTFTITPNNGYVLDELIDNNDPKTTAVVGNKYTLTGIDKDHHIVLKFKKQVKTYNLSTSVFGGNGSITPTAQTVNAGADFEFTITPAQGYILDNLKDNNIEKSSNVEDNKYKLTNIQENHTIVVKFKLDNSITEEAILNIKVYPNPTNDLLNIELSNEISNIEILTLNGKLIHKQRVNNNRYQYQTSVLAEGNYLIKIFTDNKVITKQFTVKR